MSAELVFALPFCQDDLYAGTVKGARFLRTDRIIIGCLRAWTRAEIGRARRVMGIPHLKMPADAANSSRL